MSEITPEEILARRLDQVLPPDTTKIPPQTPDPLVNTAARMAALRIPEPSDLALTRMENVVLAAFDKQYRIQHQPKQARRWVSQVSRWAVAASFVLVLLIAGLVPASAGSLPGEPLYGVMRLTERVELALASDNNTAVRLRLVYAERRALEALALLERDQFDEALLDEARTELKNAEQAASPELGASLTFQWQQQELTELIVFVEQRVQEPDEPIVTATESATPTNASTDTTMPSATPTQTGTPTGTPSITPTFTPSPTRTPRLPATPRPSQVPTDCPGNSCNSAGVPSGQIDPDSPPGQSGGRDDNPPDPPGQGDPGGGQGSGGGQGNSGNSGGGAPAGPPPSNPGGGSGNGGGNGGNGNGNGGGN